MYKRGDPVEHFYVITRGRCEVVVPGAGADDRAKRERKTPLQLQVRWPPDYLCVTLSTTEWP